jgi:hypothetical protein
MIAEYRIRYVAPEELKPYPRNARTHSRKQIRQIADSDEIITLKSHHLGTCQSWIQANKADIEREAKRSKHSYGNGQRLAEVGSDHSYYRRKLQRERAERQ